MTLELTSGPHGTVVHFGGVLVLDVEGGSPSEVEAEASARIDAQMRLIQRGLASAAAGLEPDVSRVERFPLFDARTGLFTIAWRVPCVRQGRG